MQKFQGVKVLKGKDMRNWTTTNYSSLGQLLKFLEKNEDLETNRYSSHENGSDFTGTENFGEALELLRSGSKEIMDGLKKAVGLEVAKLAKELNTLPQGYVADVTGLFFDVAKVIDGEPEAWLREPFNKEKKPRISVPILGSYNAGFRKEDAIKNASKTIALIKALEDNGFEVSLSMVFIANNVGSNDKPNMFHSVMVKDFDENFNWQKLSAMLHPSFFRRLMFRDSEIAFKDCLNSGYGQTATAGQYFENGDSMLNIGRADSIEKFKKQVLYRLKGNK